MSLIMSPSAKGRAVSTQPSALRLSSRRRPEKYGRADHNDHRWDMQNRLGTAAGSDFEIEIIQLEGGGDMLLGHHFFPLRVSITRL